MLPLSGGSKNRRAFFLSCTGASKQPYKQLRDENDGDQGDGVGRGVGGGDVARACDMDERAEGGRGGHAAGDGAEMNRFYLEQLSTHPDLMGPEVLDVLRELSEVATLAVVTNGFQKVQTRRLAESGILNFMEDVFVSEKMDAEKPNRKIFDAALRALGVENREHVLMVGDGLSSDIQGGANAGLDTCWYNPNHAENPGKVVPTYEIADLKELYPLVMEQEELANVGLKNRRHQC